MSGTLSSTFRYGPLVRWSLTVGYTWSADGELAHARVTLESRGTREQVWAGLYVAALPGGGHVDGYAEVRDLVINGGGHDRQMRVADWLLGNLREAVEHRDDLAPRTRQLWAALVEQADEAHADWFGRFGDLDPDTAVEVETHPFQTVGVLLFDRVTAELVAA